MFHIQHKTFLFKDIFKREIDTVGRQITNVSPKEPFKLTKYSRMSSIWSMAMMWSQWTKKRNLLVLNPLKRTFKFLWLFLLPVCSLILFLSRFFVKFVLILSCCQFLNFNRFFLFIILKYLRLTASISCFARHMLKTNPKLTKGKTIVEYRKNLKCPNRKKLN